jgi:uncharacterized protein (DUF2147 family)
MVQTTITENDFMKRLFSIAALAASLVFSCAAAKAETISPALQSVVGSWLNDKGGIAELRIQNGKLYGKIVRAAKDADKSGLCKTCKGSLKDKPIAGLEFLYELAPDGDKWSGGGLVDVNTGIVYQGRVWTDKGGDSLSLRGYVGNPILGQTVVWKRVK